MLLEAECFQFLNIIFGHIFWEAVCFNYFILYLRRQLHETVLYEKDSAQ